MTKPYWLLVAAGVLGCGGNGTTTAAPDLAPPASDGGTVGQHGKVIDYFNLTPLAGFTVTDGNNTTTTDANGEFVLPAPMDVDLAPVVTGPSYSTLHLATARATAADVELGPITIPSSSTFGSEMSLVNADQSKALVQVVVVPTGACTSIAGGTLTVTSPPGAAIAYFSASGFPVANAMTDTMQHRPAAVVYNIEPGGTLTVTMTHPTCKLAPAGTAYNGGVYAGPGKLLATEPGDNNAAMVLLAE